MKNRLFLLLAMLMFIVSACRKDREPPQPQQPGPTAGTRIVSNEGMPDEYMGSAEPVETDQRPHLTATPRLLNGDDVTAAGATATPRPAQTMTPTATAAPTREAGRPTAASTSSPVPPTATLIPAGPTAECPTEWFMDNPPNACPAGPALASFAARQRFERGLMIWVEEGDTFYILFNLGAHPFDDRLVFQTLGPLVLKPGASADNRVEEEPPAGLHEPVSGFGLLWRGEVEGLDVDLRQALGWAVEEETGFQTRIQCQRPETYSARTCYLLDADGSVIVLATHAIAGNVWWRWAGPAGA